MNTHLQTAHAYGVNVALKQAGYNSAEELVKEAEALGLLKQAATPMDTLRYLSTLAPHAMAGAVPGAIGGALAGGEGNRLSGALTGGALGAAGGTMGGHLYKNKQLKGLSQGTGNMGGAVMEGLQGAGGSGIDPDALRQILGG